MRVRATQAGFYANVYIEPGTVFDLLMNQDGSMPEQDVYVHTPKFVKDPATGQMTDVGDGEYKKVLDEDNQPIHRDLALDMGEELMMRGPKRGEVMRFGWMEIVPDDTPLTKIFLPSAGEMVEIDLSAFQYGFDVKTRQMRLTPPKKPQRAQVKKSGTAANPKFAKPAAA